MRREFEAENWGLGWYQRRRRTSGLRLAAYLSPPASLPLTSCLGPLPTCRAPKIYLALVISQRPFLFFIIPGHGGKTDCVNLILTFTMLMICQSSQHLWVALALAQLWVGNTDLWVGDVEMFDKFSPAMWVRLGTRQQSNTKLWLANWLGMINCCPLFSELIWSLM